MLGAARELQEESGYKSEGLELLLSFKNPSMYRYEHVYISRNCKKTANQELDSGEKTQVNLINYDEMMEAILKDNFRNQVLAYKLLQINHDPVQRKEFLSKLGISDKDSHLVAKNRKNT